MMLIWSPALSSVLRPPVNVVTSFHGCHVFAGVCYLTVILIRALLGKYDKGSVSPVELVGLFWHFVDLVWILVFTFVYLIPES